MPDTIARLESLESTEAQTPFGSHEEEVIISLAFDKPQFFTAAARFMKPDHFGRLECRWVVAEILNYYEKYSVVPTREIVRDKLENEVTEDDQYEEVFRLVDRPSNPREVPAIKDSLLKWLKTRAYGMLYSEEAVEAYHRGDFDHLEQVVQDANRIADVSEGGFWFFDNLEQLFQPDVVQHRTTGFPSLDRRLNNGGPSNKEVVCWLAATNVGKSILLCNNAISSLKGYGPAGPSGPPGQDVLLITFELDQIKTAMRCLAAATGVRTNQIAEKREFILSRMNQMKRTYNKKFLIHEMPPDECSVSHIYALLDNLKRVEGWHPDVVIIDYMDLMLSRNPAYNKDDYMRQKHVASEIRGLAKNEDVLVFTATQTNRSGSSGEEIVQLTNAAESFGKQFALDYVVSLNQSFEDRAQTPPRIRFFVAKNRNGPKHETIACTIDYDTMVVKELL